MPVVRVEPFEDVEVHVGPQSMGRAYPRGNTKDLPTVWCALQEGWISLRVVALRHIVGLHGELPKLDDGPGSDDHRELCTLARLYFKAIGKPSYSGRAHEPLDYGGGIADVACRDRSMFVECGTLGCFGFHKLLGALRQGHTLMLLPYGTGCDMTTDTSNRLHVSVGSTTAVATRLRRKGRADLGYVFEPTPTFPRQNLIEHLQCAAALRQRQWGPIMSLAAQRADKGFRERHVDLLNAMRRAHSTWIND